MRVAVMLFLTLGMLAAAPAGAGIGEGHGEIGFTLGFTDFDSDTASDEGGRFDIRGGYFFTDLIELEGQLGSAISDEFFADVVLTTVMANVVFNFHPREEIVPYALVGVGSATLQLDVGGFPFLDVDDTDAAFQVGGGSRFFFGKRKKVAVRLDASWIREGTFDEDSTHFNLVVGFTWRLGAGN